MTTVVLEHVTKRFEQTVYPFGQMFQHDTQTITAVDNISLKIPSGDVLAILGPSGCGKSTLLRLVAGTIPPDSGRILYDNVDLADVPLRERGIGMVFQEGALIPHWESRRTVGFFLSLRKREHEVPARVRQISSITGIGLDALLERRPAQLSGGERQRVAIARALTRDMRVLLFDEPFANLDAKLRAEARVELKRLLNEFPVTSIYVTHDQMEAVALSHRIAVMRAGRLEQVGTYQQLYRNPHNLFVATFVGMPPINLFPGRVENGHWYGENFGGYAIRHDLPEGAPVTMGVRPEHVRLERDGTPGVVNTITPFFAEHHQLVSVHLGRESWSLTAPLDQHIEVGSTIYCTLNADTLLYFDTEKGTRIG
jgi:ABC-type sugar transport system ATPase subunit